MDTTSFIRSAQQGNQAAFAHIVAHYQRPVFAYLGRMGLGQALAEEVAQEAFLRAWLSVHTFDPQRAQFATWLFTIAHNLAVNAVTKVAYLREEAAGNALPDTASDGPQPEQVLADKQRRQGLQRALRALPVADRSALALAYFQELGLDDVARMEGCSVAAIKVRLHRARQRLRELLEKETRHA